jgi:adenylyl cyclase-associated protein
MDFENLNVSDERAALFAELNKGEDVTRGLKKVTADMQTHKNPNLRSTGPVPAGDKKLANGSSGTQLCKASAAKTPKFALEGKKWVIEHQLGQKDLKIEKVELNQIVYLFGCKDSVIQIKGKLNAIVVDSCVKTAVVFDSLLASVEFVNSRDCQMQVIGTVPTITIDKVDGLQMFLSKESLQVEIVSAKSSALNVMVPKADGDFNEWPVPEQFKTTIGPKGLTTVATESA